MSIMTQNAYASRNFETLLKGTNGDDFHQMKHGHDRHDEPNLMV